MIHLLLPAAFAALLIATTAAAGDLILTETGDLPVILTAPHGGIEDVPECAARTPTGRRFVNRPDQRTDVLARDIADELKRLTGKSPYLVIARFHRRFIDANRRADEAYGASGCAAVYDAYHAAIRRYITEIRAQYAHAMLFDIHGQAAHPDSILRGTHHGTAVARLLARAGSERARQCVRPVRCHGLSHCPAQQHGTYRPRRSPGLYRRAHHRALRQQSGQRHRCDAA